MAECLHGRCLQERRAIKRELQRWTKNMVFVVGLERVAEELMGRRRWREVCKRRSLDSALDCVPVSDDWQPTQDLQCCFCDDSGLCLEPAPRAASDSDVDDSCSVTSESSNIAMSTLEAVTSVAASLTAAAALSVKTTVANSADGGGGTGESAGPSSPQPPPVASPSTSPATNPYLQAVAAAVAGMPSPWMAAMAAAAAANVSDSPKTELGEMPLDLSAKALLSIERDALRVPDSKNIFKARPRQGAAMATRRSYTEDELQAALRDIQSGKLGTRRAAVIYGIPRSTLRNKVYKLSMERKCDPSLSLGLLAARTPTEEETAALSGGEEEPSPASRLAATPDSLRMLLQQSRETGYPVSLAGPDLSSIDYQTLTRLLASAGEPPPGAAAAALASGANPADFLPKFPAPHVAELLNRVAAAASERHVQNGSGAEDGKRTPDPATPNDDTPRTSSPINVILKIPTFKPTGKTGGNGELPLPLSGVSRACSSSSSSSSSSTSSVVALGESSQRVGGGAASPPASSSGATPGLAVGVSPPPMSLGAKLKLGAIKLPTTHQLDLKRLHYPTSPSVIKANNSLHQNHLGGGAGSNTSSSVGGKGTRPKRGKYRNYDRDALNEAVKAVQRGEMSVHRAGSYYGVPHSTLEYKVKERHLMRPRKRDPKPLDDPLKAKEAVVQRLGPPDKLVGVPGPSKPVVPPVAAASSSATPQNGLKTERFQRFDQAARLAAGSLAYGGLPHFPFWPGAANYPPLPIDFGALNAERLFATQVMQRLQGDGAAAAAAVAAAAEGNAAAAAALGLGKTAREVAESLYDGSGANGSFLDGIIRSSLETGLPRDREANGALLDQLYRLKSRLSPPPAALTISVGPPIGRAASPRTERDGASSDEEGRDSPPAPAGPAPAPTSAPTTAPVPAGSNGPSACTTARSPTPPSPMTTAPTSPTNAPAPDPATAPAPASAWLSPSPSPTSGPNQDDESACDTIPISKVREPFT